MKCTGISYSWYAFSLPRSKKLLRLQSTLSLMTLFVICTSTLSLMKSHTLLSSLIQIRTLVATLERSPGQPGLVFIICKPEILQQARTTAEVQSESSNRSNFRRNCPAKAVVHIRHSCRERLFQFSETSTVHLPLRRPIVVGPTHCWWVKGFLIRIWVLSAINLTLLPIRRLARRWIFYLTRQCSRQKK
jgi:hypothetical protein